LREWARPRGQALIELTGYVAKVQSGDSEAIERLDSVLKAMRGALPGLMERRARAIEVLSAHYQALRDAPPEHQKTLAGFIMFELSNSCEEPRFRKVAWNDDLAKVLRRNLHVSFLAHLCTLVGALGFPKGKAVNEIKSELYDAIPKNQTARSIRRKSRP
jgi:hypothetical protein